MLDTAIAGRQGGGSAIVVWWTRVRLAAGLDEEYLGGEVVAVTVEEGAA